MEEILKECEDVVNEVCDKYEYDRQDKEGNDSLRTVLLKAVPSMLENCSVEDRQLFYQMLRHTPIVITENLTYDKYNQIFNKYIGNINPHILNEDLEDDKIGLGAYVSEPIIDEKLNIIGKKSFIYIQKTDIESEKEFFGTEIKVNHLIHELGHAWNAEKDQYTMREDGTMRSRKGMSEDIYSFSKIGDGKIIRKHEYSTGVLLDEGMNTIKEEEAMAKYMGLSLEDMKEEYVKIKKSAYQGFISNFVSYMLKNLNKEDFEHFRMYGDLESKEKIEKLMSRTDYWQNKETEILSGSGSNRSYDIKRKFISKFNDPGIQQFFKNNEQLFFPDISKMTPLEKIENVLEQNYEINKIILNNKDYYEFLNCLGYEGYALINQTADIIAKDNLMRQVGNVRLSSFNDITKQTKELEAQRKNKIETKEGEKDY